MAVSSDSLAAEGRHAFQELCIQQIGSQTADAAADVETARAEIAELSRRVVALERKVRAGVGRLRELSAVEDVERFAGEQFRQLLALPRVARVETQGSSLLIDTDDLDIEWEGRRYRLGAYRIALDLRGDVRIDSVSQLGPKAGWDHPHIQAGLPCLGNLRPGVLKLIAELELALAAQLLLEFLMIYQPESAYTPIEDWPSA